MRHDLVRLYFACLTSLLLLAAAACSGKNDNPAAPSTGSGTNKTIAYTALGASDAAGVGSSIVCVPFTACPDGTGYVPVIARDLRAGGAAVTLMNLGIPAAVLSRRIEDIGNTYGRAIPGNYIDDEAPFVPLATTLVTIFAGGNDTNAIATAVSNGAGSSDRNAYIDAQAQAFASDYNALVAAVRQRAPSARIVAANLPNFAGMPYTAGLSASDKLIMQRISVSFSTQAINPLAAQGITVVDLLCDQRFLQPSIFSADGFHPNDAGYRLLADVMLNAINQPSYPAPQSSCSLMALAGPR